MTLEKSDIIKSPNYDRFYFQVFRQPKSSHFIEKHFEGKNEDCE